MKIIKENNIKSRRALLVLLFSFLFLFLSCAEEQAVGKLKLRPQFEKIRMEYILPRVDILLAFDGNGLAPSYQQNVLDHVNRLVGPVLENQMVDFHLAAVSTSMSEDNICGHNGHLLGGDPGRRYLSRGGTDISKVLQQNLQWGPDCIPLISWHRPFKATALALSSQLSFLENRGFYRSDASLAVIFVTDRNSDRDDMNTQEFDNFLVNLKGGDRGKVALYGAIIEESASLHCLRDSGLDTTPAEIEKVIGDFNGFSFNLCAALFDQELEKVGEDISGRFGEVFIPLQEIPASGTITIHYQGHLLQKIYQDGWSYDPNRKGIRIGKKVKLPENVTASSLEISFFPAKRQ